MRLKQNLIVASLIVLVITMPTKIAYASGGSSSSQSFSTPAPRDPVDVVALYSDGVKALDAKDYKVAARKFRDVLEEQPHNADALSYLGYASRKLGKQKDSLRYYMKALKEQPNHPGANSYLGELYLEMNDVPKAEERLAVLKACCATLAPTAVLATAIDLVKAGKPFEAKNPTLSY